LQARTPPFPAMLRTAMWIEALVILALVLANGMFAGAEIAIISVRKTRMHELVQSGSRRARAVQALRREPERFLATVQIGITVIGATASAFGGASLAGHLAEALRRLGIGASADKLSLVIVVVLISYFSLVLGELVPKSLGMRWSERYALLAGVPLGLLSRAARPLVWLLTASSNVVLRFFGDKTSFTEARLSTEELRQLVDEAAEGGIVDPRAGEIAARALSAEAIPVAAAMVPRTRMTALSVDASQAQVLATLAKSEHARYPVYGTSTDDILGYVASRDLLLSLASGKAFDLRASMRPAHFVVETMRAIDALAEMQASHAPFAIVSDEHGGVAGLVTAEDLVEEFVGEISSEHEEKVRRIRRYRDGSAVVDGDASLHDVDRELEVKLASGDEVTVAGLILAMTGQLPARGAVLRAPDGTRLEVLHVARQRIARVRVTPPDRAPT
jgi:putative hemolysin